MDRSKDMEEYLKEYRKERLETKRIYLTKNICKIESTFLKKLNLLISEQLNRQEEDAAVILNYIYLCHLKSSDYTESYKAILGFSNSMLYLDEKKSQVYWYPELIYENIASDMDSIKKLLRNKFIRLENSELFSLKLKLLYDDWSLLQESFQILLSRNINIIKDSSVQLEDKILVLCGDYMDNLKIIGYM